METDREIARDFVKEKICSYYIFTVTNTAFY